MEDNNDADSAEGDEDVAARQDGVLPPSEGFDIRRNLRRASESFKDVMFPHLGLVVPLVAVVVVPGPPRPRQKAGASDA